MLINSKVLWNLWRRKLKKSKVAFSLFTAAILGVTAGCQTTTRARSSRSTSSSAFSQVNSILNQHDSQISKMTFQINQLKESNAANVRYINKLNQSVAVLNRKIISLQQMNSQLNTHLKQEETARRQETDRLLKEVANLTARAINAEKQATASAAALSRRSAPSTPKGGPAMKGEFYVYKVEPGATLGAIARAYKVSVSDIKKANRLKSDIIRVGQKLYIPKR